MNIEVITCKTVILTVKFSVSNYHAFLTEIIMRRQMDNEVILPK